MSIVQTHRNGSKKEGHSTVEYLADGVVRVNYVGHTTVAVMEEAVRHVREAISRPGTCAVVLDCERLTGYDASVSAAGLELMRAVRAPQVCTFMICGTNPAVRMMGSTLAFSAGSQLRFASTYDEGLRLTRQALTETRGAAKR